jgi:putative RNA 2'-phosphotransferase
LRIAQSSSWIWIASVIRFLNVLWTMADPTRISKSLSYWLRHRPESGGLTLDEAGWAPVADVLAALRTAGLASDAETLNNVVAGSDKNRFELSGDRARIRARQGHSVEVDLDWPAATPPEHLFHGTVERFLPAIFAEGLKPMKRHHVHFSPDPETATAVGARRGEAVILRIAAAEMAAEGHVFRLSGNGVWLTDHVPPRFIERLREAARP